MEVLRAHQRRHARQHLVGTELLHQCGLSQFGLRLAVEHRGGIALHGVFGLVVGRHVVHHQHAAGDRFDAFYHPLANLCVVPAQVEFERGTDRDDVVIDPGLKGADGEYRRFGLIDHAADDGLVAHDRHGPHHHRVFGHMRGRSVPADARQLDVDLVGAGQARPFAQANAISRVDRRHMRGQQYVRLGGKVVEAVIDHGGGAFKDLLRRLCDQYQGA
ncbi:hypothetical protein D3C84_738400 [compost metagenome]